jgi:putative endonuclease
VKRRAAERGGRRAEAVAALWLQLKGWTILARRARRRSAKSILLPAVGRTLAFSEVKARATARRGPEQSLDDFRLRRVAAAAQALEAALRPLRATRSGLTRSSFVPPLAAHVPDVCRG